MNSSVSLGQWEGNQLPDNCAFAHSKNRDISVELCKKGITLSMSEKGFCQARVLTTKIETIAELIDLWLGQNLPVDKIKTFFQEVELFEGFPEVRKGKKLQKRWNDVKNTFFKREYSSDAFHFDACTQILEQAKKDPILAKMYPYLSLGRLCFSDRAIGFSNYLCIAPIPVGPIKEKYYINLPPDHENIQIYIDNLHEALELLKLNSHKLSESLSK